MKKVLTIRSGFLNSFYIYIILIITIVILLLHDGHKINIQIFPPPSSLFYSNNYEIYFAFRYRRTLPVEY